MSVVAASSKMKSKKVSKVAAKRAAKVTSKKNASTEAEVVPSKDSSSQEIACEMKRSGATKAKTTTSKPSFDADSVAKQLLKEPSYVAVKLSKALKSRLVYKAESEGLTVSEFCEELLAEGMVLRAWEIMERKATLKQDSGNGTNRPNSNNRHHNNNQNFKHKNNSNQNNNRRPHNNNLRHNKNQSNFNNKMMDDKATFMEYLRKQESK